MIRQKQTDANQILKSCPRPGCNLNPDLCAKCAEQRKAADLARQVLFCNLLIVAEPYERQSVLDAMVRK